MILVIILEMVKIGIIGCSGLDDQYILLNKT